MISGTADPGAGSVDLLHGYQMVHSGSQAVDLDGTVAPAPGGLTQTLTGLTVGTQYILDFFYANNYGGTTASAIVSVGSLSTTITHSGSTMANSNFTEGTYLFTATSANQILTFQSTDAASSVTGIVLDDVSVNAVVPEPASVAMLGLGLVAAGAVSRLRRRNA